MCAAPVICFHSFCDEWRSIHWARQRGSNESRTSTLSSTVFSFLCACIQGAMLLIVRLSAATGWHRCTCNSSSGIAGLSSWLGRSCVQVAGQPSGAVQLPSGNLRSKVYTLSVNFSWIDSLSKPKLCRSQAKQEIAPPSHVVERYIELLCRYQPEAVYNFLKINDNYRLEEALDVRAIYI